MALIASVPETREEYEQAAREYAASLTLEDIMENTRTATQRAYMMDMLRELRDRDPRVEPFNELLVQFVHDGGLKQVVPDNMFLVTTHPHVDRTSFNRKFEPVGPFITLEYVSEGSARKDYDRNMQLYSELQVPYYLIFDPQRLDLEVYRLVGDDYVRLEPDSSGRVHVPELDLQIGMLNGWVRFWHRGELLTIQPEWSERQKARDARIKKQAEQIDQQSAQIKEHASEVSQLRSALRQAIAARAHQLGRQDILDRLATTTDVTQLQGWFSELFSGPNA